MRDLVFIRLRVLTVYNRLLSTVEMICLNEWCSITKIFNWLKLEYLVHQEWNHSLTCWRLCFVNAATFSPVLITRWWTEKWNCIKLFMSIYALSNATHSADSKILIYVKLYFPALFTDKWNHYWLGQNVCMLFHHAILAKYNW